MPSSRSLFQVPDSSAVDRASLSNHHLPTQNGRPICTYHPLFYSIRESARLQVFYICPPILSVFVYTKRVVPHVKPSKATALRAAVALPAPACCTGTQPPKGPALLGLTSLTMQVLDWPAMVPVPYMSAGMATWKGKSSLMLVARFMRPADCRARAHQRLSVLRMKPFKPDTNDDTTSCVQLVAVPSVLIM